MRIDVHNHLFPPAYNAAVSPAKIASVASSGKAPVWSPERALEVMDRNGVDLAITSVSAPGFALVDDPKSVPAVARGCNDYSARLVADHPQRFGMFAALPLPDVDATLKEIAYVYDALDSDGVCLLSNYDGRLLGDPGFRPVFEELNRRHAVVFIHPTFVPSAAASPGFSQSILEFPFDTTRTVASLLFKGVLTSFPAIRFIFSHAGGAVPYLASRMEVLSHNAPHLREPLPNGVLAELSRHYYDTALSANPVTFGSLVELASEDRILFGTDFPFGPKNQMTDAIAGLAGVSLTDSQRRKINSENALALMPGLSRALKVPA